MSISLFSLFQVGCVLQRDKPIPVWGQARAHRVLEVSLAGLSARGLSNARGDFCIHLPALPAGGPHQLRVAETGGGGACVCDDVWVGDVWLTSGQSNMEWTLGQQPAPERDNAEKREDNLLRFFRVEQRAQWGGDSGVGGTWKTAVPAHAHGHSAVAYAFGARLRESLGVPVGVIVSAWGGTKIEAWTTRSALLAQSACREWTLRSEMIAAAPERWQEGETFVPPPLPSDSPNPLPGHGERNSPHILIDNMIAPLIRYAIRGVIWYQCESNTHNPGDYAELLARMIAAWRGHGQQDPFPFLVVQLPLWLPAQVHDLHSNWARIREAQLQVAQTTEDVHLSVNLDLGDAADIHPPRKREVGERLATVALHEVYRTGTPGGGGACRKPATAHAPADTEIGAPANTRRWAGVHRVSMRRVP